jgi:TIR domain
VRGVPPIPDQVRSILSDIPTSFLFLGFGFHNWYLRVLLQVMNVYGHRSKAIAFEDTQFFDHPDHEQVAGFFSGDRLIDFKPLRWELFAQQLREAYDASNPQLPPQTSTPNPNTTPRAFLSYASEDIETVNTLAEKLETKGIKVWQDKQDLRAGDDWNRVLLDVIAKKVDYVIVVQTPAMTGAVKGVFHREIEAALLQQAEMGEFDGQKLRFLIPIKIGTCEILSSLKTAHVTDVDVSEADGMKLLVDSILEDWTKRAKLNCRTKEVA